MLKVKRKKPDCYNNQMEVDRIDSLKNGFKVKLNVPLCLPACVWFQAVRLEEGDETRLRQREKAKREIKFGMKRTGRRTERSLSVWPGYHFNEGATMLPQSIHFHND